MVDTESPIAAEICCLMKRAISIVIELLSMVNGYRPMEIKTRSGANRISSLVI